MKALLAAMLLVAPATVFAQSAVVMPAPVPNVLRTGTPVVLRLAEGITTKEKAAKINDRVRMEVAEAVAVNGVTVIPAGSPAVGELTEVRNKGMWGKSGRIVGRVLTVNANGRTIRLSGTFDSKGGSGTGGAVAVSAVVFAPAGFFMTGKSAEMPAGFTVRGFVDEDVAFAVAPGAQPNAPMMVGK
ncbi:hypothetical protein [Sphingomonas sp.]|uniref:hypothetical protein n=1 Tax=Sphingomonas sp. TaxID=28214 RepID=UPI0035C82036